MNLLPTGTATAWRMLEQHDHNSDTLTYVFEGSLSAPQGPAYLAEQLRQDGAASSLGAALSMAQEAELTYGWLYLNEDTDSECVLDEVAPWLDLSIQVQVLVAKVAVND